MRGSPWAFFAVQTTPLFLEEVNQKPFPEDPKGGTSHESVPCSPLKETARALPFQQESSPAYFPCCGPLPTDWLFLGGTKGTAASLFVIRNFSLIFPERTNLYYSPFSLPECETDLPPVSSNTPWPRDGALVGLQYVGAELSLQSNGRFF